MILILAESALELVPAEMYNHPSVLSHAKKMQKKPSDILLDNSWHYAAMLGIKNEIKRGRPDLIHTCILSVTDTPLYKKNQIQIFIHTVDNHVISIGSNVKLPRSYHRFAGLIEKLFREKEIGSLLQIKKETFPELIDRLNPSRVIGLSVMGESKSFEDIGCLLDDNMCIVVGGFQKGHFSESTSQKMDQIFSVGEMSYDAHVVISRIVYEYEKTIFM